MASNKRVKACDVQSLANAAKVSEFLKDGGEIDAEKVEHILNLKLKSLLLDSHNRVLQKATKVARFLHNAGVHDEDGTPQATALHEGLEALMQGLEKTIEEMDQEYFDYFDGIDSNLNQGERALQALMDSVKE